VALISSFRVRADAISYVVVSGTLAWIAFERAPLVGAALFFLLTALPAAPRAWKICEQFTKSLRNRLRRPRRITNNLQEKKPVPNRLPQITVVVACFNCEATLEQTVESILKSRLVDVRVIVVDDNSSDGSLEVAKKLEAKEPRVRLIRSYQNLGPSFARNVGLFHCETEFVTFLDSDDVQSDERLSQQVGPLLDDGTIQATLCLGARWDEELTFRVEQPRTISISIMFRRDLLGVAGYFDSVRAGADTEFLARIKNEFGPEKVVTIRKELLFARLRSESLTTAKTELQLWQRQADGSPKKIVSSIRNSYMDDFRRWHKSSGPHFVPFPMFQRPFPLSNLSLSASPFLGENIYGFMATFPDRSAAAPIAVRSIAGQIDELHIQANNFELAPKTLAGSNVIIHVSPETDWQELGKFIHQPGKSGYLLTLDDDITYPANYANRMVIEVELAARKALVGVHGIVYSRESPSAVAFRDVDHFDQAGAGRWVDALGTGTIAHHSDTVEFHPGDFRSMGFADMWVAIKCADLTVPMWSVPRPARWLSPLDTPRASRLYTRKQQAVAEVDGLFTREFVPKMKPKPNRLSLLPKDANGPQHV